MKANERTGLTQLRSQRRSMSPWHVLAPTSRQNSALEISSRPLAEYCNGSTETW